MDFNVNEAYIKELLKNFKEQMFVSELEYILVKSKKIYISEKTLAQTVDFSYEGMGITEILDCSLIDLVANYFNKGETTSSICFNSASEIAKPYLDSDRTSSYSFCA